MKLPVYMDNHATTRLDPRVLEAMAPYMTEMYGNAGSTSHSFGWEAKAAVDDARERIAAAIGAAPSEIVFTSGATESNNLAIRGIAESTRRRGDHFISVQTEHHAALDPLTRLARRGLDVTLLPVERTGSPRAGIVDPEQLRSELRADTAVVSVMWANNEIGAIPAIDKIAALCQERGVPIHSDATQAVGKIPVDMSRTPIDLMSFSAHKIYGPKGVGALYVRRKRPRLRLEPQINGGGQEHGLRSGTLNVPGIVGLAAALDLAVAESATEQERLMKLRDLLFSGLRNQLPDVSLNGPTLDERGLRLPGNLNLSFAYVDGEALLLSMKQLAVSSGSACTSANPEPSHVLRAIGLDDDLARSSLRFGLGRFNTEQEVAFAIEEVVTSVRKLRELSAWGEETNKASEPATRLTSPAPSASRSPSQK